jgi:hypothetical protein
VHGMLAYHHLIAHHIACEGLQRSSQWQVCHFTAPPMLFLLAVPDVMGATSTKPSRGVFGALNHAPMQPCSCPAPTVAVSAAATCRWALLQH